MGCELPLDLRSGHVARFLPAFDLTLEDGGAIATKRGRVTVLDRVGLEGVAGDSYGGPEAEYTRLIGLPLTL